MTNPDITRLSQLNGQVVGDKGSFPATVEAIVVKAGVTWSTIRIVQEGYDPTVLPRRAGGLAALTGFVSNEPNQLKAAGYKVTVWQPIKYGIPLPRRDGRQPGVRGRAPDGRRGPAPGRHSRLRLLLGHGRGDRAVRRLHRGAVRPHLRHEAERGDLADRDAGGGGQPDTQGSRWAASTQRTPGGWSPCCTRFPAFRPASRRPKAADWFDNSYLTALYQRRSAGLARAVGALAPPYRADGDPRAS